MFLRYYLDLAVAFDDVETSVLADPDTWIPGMLLAAEDRSHRLLGEVGFAVEEGRVGKEVEIRLGAPYRIPGKTLLPIMWRATGAQWLFPQLDGDIEAAALGPTRTQLSISARYRPPMGGLGRMLDRAFLHRVAEATIKDFLDRVGTRIERAVRIPGPSVAAG